MIILDPKTGLSITIDGPQAAHPVAPGPATASPATVSSMTGDAAMATTRPTSTLFGAIIAAAFVIALFSTVQAVAMLASSYAGPTYNSAGLDMGDRF